MRFRKFRGILRITSKNQWECFFFKLYILNSAQYILNKFWENGNKDLIVHPCSPKSTNEVRYQSSIISLRNAMGFGPTLHGRCKHRHTRVQKAIASAQTQKKPASCTKHFGLLLPTWHQNHEPEFHPSKKHEPSFHLSGWHLFFPPEFHPFKTMIKWC